MSRALLLAVAVGTACATVPVPEAPADWRAHQVCGPDSRRGEDYCLEVIELTTRPQRPRGVAVLVPGMFQNAWSFDVLPEEGISFARFLVSRGLAVYFVHVRGIGTSDYPPGSNLDDIVIDDLPRALSFVAEREGRRVILVGQSQGSMTLLATLAGLSRCPSGPCFDPAVARARQSQVHSVGLFTGNVALTGRAPLLRAAACAGLAFQLPLSILDRLPARPLAARYGAALPEGLARIVYRRELVSPEAESALHARTVDSSTMGIALQLADGLEQGSVRSGGARWVDHLGNVEVPVVQTTFELDVLAAPGPTWRDAFRRLGSKNKKFKRVRGQSHEDWMLVKALHAQHWMTVEELIEGVK